MGLRSLIAAACLVSGLLLSACPQATQTFAPGVYNAGDPSPSEDRLEELPPPDPTTEAPASGAQGDGSSTGSGSSTGGGSIPSGTFIEAGDRTWALQPIEPKNDQKEVEDPFAFKDARLRYGKNYTKVLSKSVPADRTLATPVATISLRFKMDIIAMVDDWEPLVDFLGKPQLRAVYAPKGSTPAGAKYTDAKWEVAGDGRILYTFPSLKVGEGQLIFSMANLNELPSVLEEKTSDYHQGDLIALPSGDPSNPFPAGEGPVYALGSFRLTHTEVSDPSP
jgi:hypothetical protein